MRTFKIGDSLVLNNGTKCTIVGMRFINDSNELLYEVDINTGDYDFTVVRTKDIMCVL